MKEKLKGRAGDWALLLGLSIIWGFSFFFIKKGLIVFDAFQVGALRIFLAFISILPLALFRKMPLKKRNVIPLIWIALLGSGLPPFLFSIAQLKIDSSVTGILNATVPLFTLLLGVFFYKIAFNKNQLVGVLAGLLGAVLIVLIRSDGSFEFNFAYALLVIAATLCYGMNANLLKKYIHDIDPITVAFYAFVFIGPFAGLYLFTTDFLEVMKTNPNAWSSLWYLIILAVLGTSYALVVFNVLVQRTSALFATTVTYLIPIVAVFIGVLDGETLGVIHILGLGLILFGVYITNKSKKVT